MKAFAGVFALSVLMMCLGCLCNQPAEYSITPAGDGLLQYSSKSHGGFSFKYDSNLSLNNESSYDTSLMTGLNFNGNDSGALFVGIMPDIVAQKGWLKEACDKDKLAAQLKAQSDLNVTKVNSVQERNYTRVKSCIADVVAVDRGMEVPMSVAFGECNNTVPMYAVSGGQSAMQEMELLLSSFNC
jgi:hypothetical protein